MDFEFRTGYYREMIATLACVIYNEDESWDKQTVASQFHMGNKRFDYMFPEDSVPEKLSREDVLDAIDKIFERGGV